MIKNKNVIDLLYCIVFVGFFGYIIFTCIGGCRQITTKSFGGSMTVNLEPNTKLVNATWKDAQLWLLTTGRTTNDLPQVYHFKEKSTLGVLQGNVTIIEK